MGSEWKEANLTDLYEISSGLSKSADSFGSGYPFLSFKDVFYNVFAPENLSQLVQTTAKEQESCSIKRGDVFLTRTSETMHELGMSCVALKDYESATFNGFTKRLRPKSINELVPEYVGYYLRSPKFRAGMLAFSTMSTRASLNNEMIGKLKIQFPGVEVQRLIAGILKSLDNKITLNRQLNQTLEHMAQALFKSWFVDFDPVIDNALAAGNAIPDDLQDRAERRQLQLAKADHKPLPENIRKLFPSEFEVTESLGWVPLGWGEGTLADVASYATEKVNTAELSLETYISTENMNVEKSGICSAASLPGSDQVPKFVNGQTLISNIRPYFKKIWLASFSGGRSADVLGFKAKNKGTNEYLFNLLYQDTFFDYMMATSKGTKMPRGDKSAIMSWPAVKPSPKLMEVFSNTVKPFYSANQLRSNQSSALSEARDTLLPKLISGELRIPEAESALTLALSQRERGLESASE